MICRSSSVESLNKWRVVSIVLTFQIFLADTNGDSFADGDMYELVSILFSMRRVPRFVKLRNRRLK